MIRTQALHGMVRFYLRSVRPDFELYASPVNYDPMTPDVPISTPVDFAAELAKATGRYYTQGMPEDTKVFQEGVMNVDEFLMQSDDFGARSSSSSTSTCSTASTRGCSSTTPETSTKSATSCGRRSTPTHPMYDPEVDPKYAGIIEGLYEDLDDLVGYTVEHMGDDTTLIVMSDHGFASFRRSFNMNAWLRENGYLVVKDPDPQERPRALRQRRLEPHPGVRNRHQRVCTSTYAGAKRTASSHRIGAKS